MKSLFLILFFTPFFVKAQTTHTVAPKESLYSLARKYNVHPRELAAFNNIPIETSLTIGQVIKIPSSTTLPALPKTAPAPAPVINETQAASPPLKGPVEMYPIMHRVAGKETLYRLSKLYPGTTVDDIKKWNHLTGDGLAEGMNLIVGYQKEKPAERPNVSAAQSETVQTTSAAIPKQTAEQNTPKKVVAEKAVPNEDKPVVGSRNASPPAQVDNPVITAPASPEKTSATNMGGGFFKTQFEAQAQKKKIVEESGIAATFKSTSGWEDGKYYCLHNTAAAGSVIKITNKSNQRFVYAKVLDVIPDLKQNVGVTVRLSNAAADQLGAGESNFDTTLNY